jgi:DNA-binding beta-propeller fold protein YncE
VRTKRANTNPKNDAVTDVTLSSGASLLRNVAINPETGYAYISDSENNVVDVVHRSEMAQSRW